MTPAADPVIEYDLEGLLARLVQQRGGEVDDSIPELASADPDVVGLAVVTADGRVVQAGDSDVVFSLQSAVKPFVYALALADDRERVTEAVGSEPTGEAFDAIHLESGTGRPANPLVNAGALLTATLVAGEDRAAKSARALAGLSAFAGDELVQDTAVSRSEQLLGDRNHALGHLMRSEGLLTMEVDEAVGIYADVCAVQVTTVSLAVMGATLALGGRNPVTGQQVVSEQVARDTMSVMATCGMYDGSGRWLQRVGFPAKSGVSGSLVAAVPRRLGLGVYSAPIDATGNSVRGVLACEALSDDLGLHVLQPS